MVTCSHAPFSEAHAPGTFKFNSDTEWESSLSCPGRGSLPSGGLAGFSGPNVGVLTVTPPPRWVPAFLDEATGCSGNGRLGRWLVGERGWEGKRVQVASVWPQGTGHELTVSSPWPRLPRGPLLRAGHLRERGLAAEALWGPGGQGQGLHQALHRQPERQVGGHALSSLLHFYSRSEERPAGAGHRPAWCQACHSPSGRASLNFPT